MMNSENKADLLIWRHEGANDALTNEAFLAMANAFTETYTVKIPGSVVYEAILGTGAIAILKHLEAQITSQNPQVQQLAGAASGALAVINSPVERDFALDEGQIHDALDALQASGFFPAGFDEFVRNLSRRLRTPAQARYGSDLTLVEGVETLTMADVNEAENSDAIAKTWRLETAMSTAGQACEIMVRNARSALQNGTADSAPTQEQIAAHYAQILGDALNVG